MLKTEISIEGTMCSHCVRHVTEALEELKGVVTVTVSLEDKKAIIEHSKDLSIYDVKAAIVDAGYEMTEPLV